MTTVFIVDDQAMVRESFAGLLNAQPGLAVVGQAGDGIAALAGISALDTPPDVVLMDIRMPGMDGLEATRRLLEGGGEKPKVIVLTTFHLDDYVYEALRAGASGFLLKDAPAAELITAIGVVAAGNALLSPAVTKRLIANFVSAAPVPRPSPARFDVLTERERDVLRLIAKGRSNPEIAADLVLSAQTVKTYVGRILAKLGVRDRAQAIVLAYETGLVSP